MEIILVSKRLATARTLVITPRLVAAAVTAFLMLVLLMAWVLSYLSVQWQVPYVQDLLLSVQHRETQRTQGFVRDNLNAMAVRLGQLQAEMMRLESVSERLSTMSGGKIERTAPAAEQRGGGQGGPLIEAHDHTDPAVLQRELERFSAQVEMRAEQFDTLEAQLFEQHLKRVRLPTALPVNVQWSASAFGFRIDPFTGQRAMHEGIDFVAGVGTPIMAAAGGVVRTAEYHPQYGNLVEIDHGNGISTRYAHAARFFVKSGQVVRRLQKIAEVGLTGRTTGPHLHFEVRLNGVAQNPARFLVQTLPQLSARH